MRNYVTPVEVAKILGIDYTNETLLQEVAIMVEAAEDFIDDYCGTTFVQETGVARLYDGMGMTVISLGYFLRNLDTVEVVDSDGTTVLETLDDVFPGPNPCRLGAYRFVQRGYDDYRVQNTFPLGFGNVLITGDWGYTEIPGPVKLAIAWTVKDWWEKRQLSTNVKFESGYGRYIHYHEPSKITPIPPHAQKLLDRYVNSRMMSF